MLSLNPTTFFTCTRWGQLKIDKNPLLSIVIFLLKQKHLSTSSKPVFPNYQGESTIFDKGNFLFQTPDTKNFIKFKGGIRPQSTPSFKQDKTKNL